ncbi:LuxR C-terminal-related transcriptional regulator [Streptomyces scabiei]|uniref:LuxR C-terminal-related transcriptional regulator n=1 Tax=Streptomyces scabiei TaxID=1930 RepID=UPI00298FD637|nr:LuxR C-terminal-related transcriptional regulator [Streptomyces scabiei]MDW8805377.1 LuxR C-terminal-related transcriptional regulator [Streptomyces scabiei]
MIEKMQSQTSATIDTRQQYVRALQSALSVDEVTDAFMRAGAPMIPSDAHAAYRLHTDADRVGIMGVSAQQSFLDDYEDYGRRDDPVLEFALRELRAIDSSRVPVPEVWESSGAHAALGVAGFVHSLEAPVIVGGAVFGTLNFARAQSRPRFSRRDLVAAGFMGEQLGLAMERALRFEATGRRVGFLEQALDSLAQPVVVTDLDCRTLFRNRAARKLEAGGADGLGGPLDVPIAEAMEEFRTSGRRVYTGSVHDPGSGEHLMTRSLHVSQTQDVAVTLVFKADSERTRTLPAWNVLSRREQEIAEFVAQGLSTRQIAEHAFITENTVKQHLKRMFAKVDARNRAELIQRVWANGGNAGATG